MGREVVDGVAHVIGTAGHVDHGKSALVLALTGTDPDRLAEEKARGMTIDLGFAWTRLPSGREVGFVDVPGHERFIHNMLAGVGGVDCALFVVDATEGWMPQSEEHLAVLDLLGIRTGVVAVTKADLCDPATIEAVSLQVRDRLRGTNLEGAAILPTAAPPGPGGSRAIDALRAALDQALDRAAEPPDLGRPRLPVDRVFSARGSGTVVTGTLSGGTLTADVEAELLPAGRRVRIRALQGHGAPLAKAEPARRLAVNLAGVATGEVARGDVLVLPGQWAPTRMADCRLRCVATAPAPLRSRGAYLLYAGAAETAVRLQPLDAHEVAPGEEALVRLHLERPLVLDFLEAVVLRDSGRDETVGGGRVLDPYPRRSVHGTALRVRRAEELEARERAGRAGLLGCVLAERGVVPRADLPRLTGSGSGDALRSSGSEVVQSRTLAWSPRAWEAAQAAVLAAVERFHRDQPLAAGLPAPAARRAALAVAAGAGWPAGWPPAAGAEAAEALVAARRLRLDRAELRLPGHGVRLDPAQEAVRAKVEAAANNAGVSVLSETELAALGADRRLLAVLVALAPGRYLGSATLDRAVQRLRDAFPGGRSFSASEAKEALGTTRKTAIPLLEYLDQHGVTARNGDLRWVRELRE
jgi:selenocysteine-specific elongation factor